MTAMCLLASSLFFAPAVPDAPAATSAPAARTVWQIGQFDDHTADLALGPADYRQYADDGLFIVGLSDPRRDWPYVQPGPLDHWAGGRAHDFIVRFGLATLSDNAEFKLTLDFVDTQWVRPPQLAVVVNGTKIGTWNAPAGGGEKSIEGDPSKGRAALAEFAIPGARLRAGENVLNIRIEDGCWVLYDALRLDCLRGAAEIGAVAPAITVEPLPQEQALYRGPAGLEQALRGRVLRIGPPCDAEIYVDGQPVSKTALRSGRQTVSIRVARAEQPAVRQLDLVVDERCRDGAYVQVEPVRPWEIYLLPHSHVDIGYTNIQDIVEQVHTRNILESIELAKATQPYPKEAHYRWNVETIWATDAYLKKADAKQRAALIEAVRNGWINLDASYVHALSGMTRPEELLRNFRLSRDLAAETGVPIDSMMLVDVPGAAWGIVPAMAHAGVKYFLMSPNALDRIGRARAAWEDRPFYWVSPSGRERVLVWQVAHYSIGHFLKGYAYTKELTSIDVPPPLKTSKPGAHFLDGYVWDRLRQLADERFAYDMLALTWGLRDNAPIDADLPDAVRAWNERYAHPRIIISSTRDMFREFERRYAARVPEVRGDYSPYWEEGAASTAHESAVNRAASERLVQAEALWALHRPGDYRLAEFLDAWRFALLFSEHTWGAHSSVWEPDTEFVKKQWEIKRAFAEQADARSRALLAAALDGRGPAVADAVDVLNTSSWARSDLVLLPPEQSRAGDRVESIGGRPVPSQRLRGGELAFLARNVPAFGAARYVVRPGAAHVEARARVDAALLESDRYDVRVDGRSGAISSIRTRPEGRELVDPAAVHAMNAYLYLRGDDVSRVEHSGLASINPGELGPLVASLKIEAPAPGAKRLVREVRLVAGLDRVDIVNLIDKQAVREKEGVHFAFPTHVVGGRMRLDTPWAVVRPEVDQLPGANKNWFSVQRWVDVSNERHGVTWATVDAALIEIGGLTGNLLGTQADPAGWIKTLKPSQTFYSWVMNNHWHTNYRADQSGPALFRYALRAHDGYDAAAAARFGLERNQPLIVAPAAGPPPGDPPLRVSARGAVVSAFKPSDDGRALILRLFGASGEDERVQLTWRDGRPRRIHLTDLTEQPRDPAGDPVTVPAWGIVSLRIQTEHSATR